MFLRRSFSLLLVIYFVTCAEVLIDSDGGYKNIVVGISPQIPESNIEFVLLQLEILFRNASDALYTATRRQTYFREVIFALPKKYKTHLSQRNWIRSAKYFRSPDIFMTSNDLAVNPYTVQHAGCGRPGLRINIPEDFLFSSDNNKGKSLVREWAHYRYGVFDENGFAGDELYPACYSTPGSNSIKINDCTNEKAIYEFRKISKDEREQFPQFCNPVPSDGQNNDIVSSLMTKMDFPEVSHFCDDEYYPHNSNVPSKHNNLCREQSTWKIISKHSDFKFKRIGNNKRTLSFKYVLESDPHFVLAVDTSSNMALNDRMDLLRNAFSYFVLYALPQNTTARLINLKNTESEPSLITFNNQADAERLIDTFPEAYGEGNVCVHCGIQKSIQLLNVDSASSGGTIIVAAATDIVEQLAKNLTISLKSSDVTLHVIYFKKRMKQPPRLERLAKSSGGRFFYIAEDFPEENPSSSLTLLYEAFRSIYESFSWMNRSHVLVDQMTFRKNSSSKYSMSFSSDPSIERFHVLLTGPEFIVGPPVIKDTIVLVNGNNSYAPGDPSFAYKIKIPAYVFTIENPEPGTWEFNFQRKPGFNKPLVVMIRAFSKNYDDIINVHSWITSDDSTKRTFLKYPPVVFYSEVKKGNFPVLNATVTAFIYKSDSNKETELQLNDGGDGDPDITKNDGIFSRYFLNADEPGYYFLSMHVERQTPRLQYQDVTQDVKLRHCCGSFIPDSLAYDSGPFKRVVTFDIFLDNEKLTSKFPPRRISDLRVEKVVILENNVKYYVFTWTAPGENYDHGTASEYQLRVFRNREDPAIDFDKKYIVMVSDWNIHGPMLIPEEAGSLQSAIVELTNLTSGIYYLAMRAMNAEGNYGEISNVVEIVYEKPIVSLTSSPPPSTNGPFTRFPGDKDYTDSDIQPVALASDLHLAIGISCGILFLLLIIGIMIYIYFERYRKNKGIKRPGLDQNAQKTESSDTLCRSTGTGNISIISPVNSWAADSLISHYETLKKNKNSDSIGIPTVPQDEPSDSVSIASSKYSYINKIDQNSSLYDPVYFEARERGHVNFPYNPSYAPFIPIHTSSLRREPDDTRLVNHFSPIDTNYYSSTLERRQVQRLRTDV